MSDLADSELTGTPELIQARLTLALNAGGAGTWQWDHRTGEVRLDAALERIYGLEPGRFPGTFEAWAQLLHPEDRESALASLHQSLQQGQGHETEYRVTHADGTVRWIHGRGEVVADEYGEYVGMHGVAVDITERRAAEAERDRLLSAEQHARNQLAFLADASAVLSRSLNANAAMSELANLAVPRLADWCVVDLVSSEGLHLAAAAHRESHKADLVREWRRAYPPSNAHGAGKVVRTGSPELLDEIDDDLLQQAAQDQPHLELLRSLGFRSAVVVPLVARNRVLGALTLIHDLGSERRHTTDDLALAQELAGRAGVALDNAQLFQDRARVANVLQRALLPPELPSIPGVQLAARHQPASQAVIGGDFYDVFENADGSWTLLVGDVCGKDITAATLTALARHSARAAAVRDSSPASILDVVNQAFLQQSETEQFCTASVHLGPGEALVVYTDGVTEARRGDELFGEDRLLATLRGGGTHDADALANRLLAAVASFDNGERRDDIAVLTLRVPPA